MKFRLGVLIFLFLLVLFPVLALASTWAKTYGGSSNEYAWSIQQGSDGGFIVAGYTNSFGAGNGDYWVLKLDANGNIIWQKTYGGSHYDFARPIQQTSDGGFIVAGSTTTFGTDYSDWILKLDANGNVTWQKAYGGNSLDYANSIQQTSDGGYIVAGYTHSFGAGNGDYWVLKLDANGNITWQKTYGGSGSDWANSIQQSSDGGFIVAGYTNSFGAGYSDYWVLKLDANGNVIWQKTYGGTFFDNARSIQQTSDGGFIVAGDTDTYGIDVYYTWVLKLDANGNVIWQKTYGGLSAAYSIQQTSDGGFVVAGESWWSYVTVGYDIWVLKLDSNGNIPGCNLIQDISVVSANTSVIPGTTSITPALTHATVTSTSVIPQLTSAIVDEQCFDEGFVDVPPGHWAEEAIYKIYNAGITKGCSVNPLMYCPDKSVSKAAMAVFLLRTLHGGNYTPPPAIGIFTDVNVNEWYAPWVEQLYKEGITKGCSASPLMYCPDRDVSKASMALFLLRAKYGKSYTPPVASGIFTDVDLSHWGADWIEKLYNDGITKGCSASPLMYCPDRAVSRAAMALFLVRTFGL